MLPCQKNCHSYCVGCHKACPHFRAMQEQQRRDLARKKEYLRRADESCRTVLHQCRAAGGSASHGRLYYNSTLWEVLSWFVP